MSNFKKYVESILSVDEMRDLHKALGITKTLRTQLLNSPEKGDFDMLLLFADILKTRPFVLVSEYGFGGNTFSERVLEFIRAQHYDTGGMLPAESVAA